MKNDYKIKNEVEIDFLEIDINKLRKLLLKTKKKKLTKNLEKTKKFL
ncbi:hypothetical protein [Sulfurimonas sp.]|nr:hypothetical protein [Sulfurimonas sp.]MBW6488439.1 hypothetical protein [Sulfurimonas sp.]